MHPGAPEQARWHRPAPHRAYSPQQIECMVRAAFPQARVLEVHPLDGGQRNANLLLRLESPDAQVVLRIYQHDASLCQKECDVIRLVAPNVPVPEILHAAPRGLDEFPPYLVMRFVEGVSFRELLHRGDAGAVAEASRSAGETLAAIAQFTFEKSGWLGPGPGVGAPLLEGADPMPRFVDLCLANENVRTRISAELRHRASALAWSVAPELATLANESHLVHGDFNKRNLLVHHTAGRWSVAAVLDWEFAVSASPLADIGNFLRDERVSHPRAEPHFSEGYQQAGGTLPRDWRRLSKLVDLAALCEILTHDRVPDEIISEVVELIRASVENRDPQLS